MRHAKTGRKLGRDASHRKALYANLTCSLFEHGRIRTTEAKAKAVKPYAERMITLARRGDLHARRQALSELRSQEIVHKLFADVAPRFADRPCGSSRLRSFPRRAAACGVSLTLWSCNTSRSPSRSTGTSGRARSTAASS